MVLLSIFAGGAFGALARYAVSQRIYLRLGESFPWGTLTVNTAGSFALGLLLPLLDVQAPITAVRAFVTVGFIGAFTTFSTFAYEAVILAGEGRPWRSAGYAALSVALGLASLAAGLGLHRLVFHP